MLMGAEDLKNFAKFKLKRLMAIMLLANKKPRQAGAVNK
jgi:hypothetical protein